MKTKQSVKTRMYNLDCKFLRSAKAFLLKKARQPLFLFLGILCLLFYVTGAPAQVPYVYTVENTGASYPAPPLPTLANCPYVYYLPDPFAWADGSGRSTDFSDWSHHRNDFRAMIENYEIGTKPVVDPAIQVTASYSGGTLTINITANGQSMTMTCAVSIPSGATAPYPVCIGMNSSYGSVTSSLFTSRGIVGITYSHDQVTTYNSPSNTNPFFRLYPTQNIDNTGQYAAWAWGVSRIIDALYKIKAAGSFNADLDHICVTGCSYAGKMALFSGAFDERVALTIAQESGGGGAPSWRYSKTEPDGSVEGLAQTSSQWFKNSMFDFGGDNVWYLPDDHHELMAMCAPRALLVTGNTDYEWLSNPSCYVSSRAVQQIYGTLGIADRFGFIVDGGHSHCAIPSSQNAAISYFLDKFIKGNTSLSQIVETYPSSYSTIDYAIWYQGWGPVTPIAVTGVSVSPETATVGLAATSQLTATISPANATNKSVTWSSSNTGVATVSSTGLVTGVAIGTATITATTVDGGFTDVSEVTVTPSAPVYINVGGSATGNYAADQYYSGGTTYTNSATIDMSQITSNAPPAAIFNTERYGAFTYTIPGRVAGSTQTVTLYFAETYITSSGGRVFNVSINGTTVLSNFDIYVSAGGQNKAIARSFSTTANSSGQVVIQFSSITENPKVNGIAVVEDEGGTTLSVSPTSVSVAAAANSTGTFNVTSNTSWTVSDDQSWLTVSPTSGSNNATITVTAEENTSASTRSATVTVSASGVSSKTVTVTQAAASGGTTSVWLEAECGTVGSLWNTNTDVNASSGEYVTIQPGNNSTGSAPSSSTGQIAFPFSVSESGNYVVWGRVITPTADDDSYWIRMDGGTWVMWNSIPAGTSWHWDDVHDSNNGSAIMIYNLSAGSHTLDVGYREDGTQLDKIYITNSGSIPSGEGSTATNCSSNQAPTANAGTDQTVTDSDNSGSESATLDGTGSSDSDGAITSYVWTEGGNQIATGANPSVSFAVGTHNVTLTVTDNDDATDTDDVVITVNAGSGGGDEHIWLEAECGTVGSLWNTNTDANASNGEYVTIQPGNNSTRSAPSSASGQISYSFSVASSGTYTLWGRVIAPTLNDDSFWIRMDGGSWYAWKKITRSSSWIWDDCKSYSLSAGSHTLTVAYCEDGTKLDKLYITNTSDTPSGTGSSASNCLSKPIAPEEIAPEIQSVPKEFVLGQNNPNPFNPETEISYQLTHDSQVTLTIYDVLGHKIRTLVHEHQRGGYYSVLWDATDDHGNRVISGVYFYEIRVIAKNELHKQTRKMTLMK